MSNKLRRFEILLPLQFNDGREIPNDWLAEAVLEIVEHFGAASLSLKKSKDIGGIKAFYIGTIW
jgi:hypothetical protein